MAFPNDPTARPRTYSLEEALALLAEKNDLDAQELAPRYKAMKLYLEKQYYPWIQATCPYYTDHGVNHVNSVIRAASGLLERHLDPDGKGLNAIEIFLVLAAILWHDVGNALGRSGHADRIPEMTAEIRNLAFPDPALHRIVVEIAQAHAGPDGLSKARAEADCTLVRTVTVFPRALAAIVRFADEISENRSRISLALMPKVPDESQIYWQFANCVTASRPDPLRDRVVLTIEVQDVVAPQRFLCPHELSSRADASKQMSLIQYLILRLEKMNNELAYCEPEFRGRYGTIREILVRLSIIADTKLLNGYDLEFALAGNGLAQATYPSIEVFDHFFEKYPTWRPEAIDAARKRI